MFYHVHEMHFMLLCVILTLYLLYILNLIFNKLENSKYGQKKQAKSHQISKTVGGYKWSRKAAIFGKVTEKGQT